MPRTLAVRHQRDVVDRVEQQAPNEALEPPVHRLPGREIAGQHLPATARTNPIADRVDHFPQIGLSRSAFLRWRRKQPHDHRPLLIGQIGRVSLELLSDLGHAATRFGCPHGQLESRPHATLKLFQKASKGYDEPEILPSSTHPVCLMIPDAGQCFA
jgi:hypothetical protein